MDLLQDKPRARQSRWEDAYDVVDVALAGYEDGRLEKIRTIKEVREVTGLGLKEAKELVERVKGSPELLVESIHRHEAEDLQARFQKIGAQVEIQETVT